MSTTSSDECVSLGMNAGAKSLLGGDDFGVVHEPVDHGGGDDVVAEDLAPARERLFGGDDHRGALVHPSRPARWHSRKTSTKPGNSRPICHRFSRLALLAGSGEARFSHTTPNRCAAARMSVDHPVQRVTTGSLSRPPQKDEGGGHAAAPSSVLSWRCDELREPGTPAVSAGSCSATCSSRRRGRRARVRRPRIRGCRTARPAPDRCGGSGPR